MLHVQAHVNIQEPQQIQFKAAEFLFKSAGFGS